jgi:DNA-binding CsgD family transcriptional regulator
MTASIAGPDLARPLRAGLERLQRATGVDCAMGGLVERSGTRLVITELHNTRTNAFRGTVVTPGAGAGGQAWRLARPVAVDDYLRSPTITHHYDHQAQREHANGTFAVPVRVGPHVGGLIWGLMWTPQPLGDRVLDTARPVAARLGHELAVEIEVVRRLADLEEERRRVSRCRPAVLNPLEIREELLSIAHTTSDAGVRDRLVLVCDRLCPPDTDARLNLLTSRERDVLAQIALGLTNDEVAERLALMPTTVKSYLKNAMRKFGTRNRVETIRAARQAGLII